jgi:hypothetical protein
MDNYVQQMWQTHNAHQTDGNAARIVAWVVGIAAAVAAIAYASQPYWYPHVAAYL